MDGTRFPAIVRFVARTEHTEPDPGLAALGLAAGDRVRWRRAAGGHWQMGVASRRERDGSVGVTDGRGMARSMPVERLEVPIPGRRGPAAWESLVERLSRAEQLRLL